MLELLTPKAQTVIELAERAAQLSGHRNLEVEHLIAGMLNEGTCLAFLALKLCGLTAESFNIRPIGVHVINSSQGNDLPDSCLQVILKLSGKECTALQDSYIGPEHLLLAIADTADGSKWMAGHNVSSSVVRTTVLRLMGRS